MARATAALRLTPMGWAALTLGVFSAVWLTILGLGVWTPPQDNVEQTVWLRSLEWGYHKHPPLPTWLAFAAAQVLGPGAWMTYVLGVGCTVLALGLYAGLLRQLIGARLAGLCLLATLCITFYNGRLYYYNHNVVMMLAVAAVASLSWRVAMHPQRRTWLLIGVVFGLGMLSKYQMLLAGLCLLGWWWRLAGWRSPVHRQGLLLALLAAVAVCLPHALWLMQHDAATLRYAQHSSLSVTRTAGAQVLHVGVWVLDWLANRSALAWVLLAGVVLGARWQERRALAAQTVPSIAWSDGAAMSQPLGPKREVALPPALVPGSLASAAVRLWGWGPLLLMAAAGLLGSVTGGVELQPHWPTAFALWTVPAVVIRVRSLAGLAYGVPWRWALGGFVMIQAGLLLSFWLSSPWGPHQWRSTHWRNFPSAQLAAALAEPARRELGGPIEVISGPGNVSGAVALQLPERPLVLIDGDCAKSPWVDCQRLSRQRVVTLAPVPERQPLPPGWRSAGPGWVWQLKRPVARPK